MKIVICSDHGGYELKEKIKSYLTDKKYEVVDCGAEKFDENDSYVYYGKLANAQMKKCEYNAIGIYICGSGVGMSMVANREKGIRAVNGTNEVIVEMARKHNNANVLCLGSRYLDYETVLKYIDIFITTQFEGGRHQTRVEDLDK